MQPRNYIDFKLYLTGAPNGACQVALLPTPEVGESVTPVIVPAENGPSANLLPFVASKGITLRKLVEFGKGLANWLLPTVSADGQEPIRDLFVEALKRAGNEAGVRLRVIIADPTLKKWPWEYSYFDAFGVGGPDSMSGFLVLNPCVSIVRHEPLPHPHPAAKMTNTDLTELRMVIAAASPKTQPKLDVDKEISYITKALKDFKVDNTRITTIPIIDATLPEVAKALQGADSTCIFHFAGHGISEVTKQDPFSIGKTREEGFLYFLEDKNEKTEAKIRADDLASLLQAAGVRMAVFGACYSGMRSERYPWDSVAGALARRDIPAIITMQYEVYDAHATAFTGAFYGALAAGLSLDEAMTAGRLAMFALTSAQLDQTGFLEWGGPVLYSRLPDGKLFPERMNRTGPAAQQLRTTIQQTVTTITSTGRVVGIKAKMVNGAFTVNQKVETVDGELIGAELHEEGGSASIEQDIGKVSGNVTGLKLDKDI